jgi:hypothetical protein
MAVKVLICLCENPDLIQPLREEIVAVCGENGLPHNGEAPSMQFHGFARYRDPNARIRVRRRTTDEVSEGILAGF